MDAHMFDTLVKRLEEGQARFRILRHPAAGTSELAARIRGTLPGQGAKAMLCRLKENPHSLALAVLPGDQKLDFRKLAQALGGKKASLVTPDEAQKLTGCVVGAIPPFSFHPDIALIVDPNLLERHAEIAFNAGSLEASIVLDSADYRRIAAPRLAEIAVEPAPASGV